jgi:acyl dehydratase
VAKLIHLELDLGNIGPPLSEGAQAPGFPRRWSSSLFSKIAKARISGAFNPVHLDEAHAATTPFKQRIAHGILISAIFGTK